MVRGALSPPFGREGAPGVGCVRSNQRLVGEQSVSVQVNIPASTIVLHSPAPLFPTFSEKHTHVLTGYRVCFERKLCANYTITMTQMHAPDMCEVYLTSREINPICLLREKISTNNHALQRVQNLVPF